MDGVLLAGTLEKRSRWRREWTPRFFVLRHDRIDYFLSAPAILDDSAHELRGTIPLASAMQTEEPGHPNCFRVGAEILSCRSEAERGRWVETINAAAAELQARHPSFSGRLERCSSEDGEEPRLVLLPPDAPPRPLGWRKCTEVVLQGPASTATVLFLDDGAGKGESRVCGFCQLPLYAAPVQREARFRVEAFAAGSEEGPRELCARVHANQPAAAAPLKALGSQLTRPAVLCLSVAVACLGALEADSTVTAGRVALLFSLLALALEVLWPPVASRQQQRRRVVFSVESLELQPLSSSPALATSASSMSAPAGTSPSTSLPGALGRAPPLWVGRWTVDKSCSDRYEPILLDMGVNMLIRKAADAVRAGLEISASATHVTILVKTIVSVEDCLPLDGSYVTKPVPPGGRMKGQCKVRLTKVTDTELEMYTEFPDGEGDLRDTLTVDQGGASFTRRVVRGQLVCNRVFRRDPA